jgi:hypothetical protein
MGRVRKIFTLCAALASPLLAAWTRPDTPSTAPHAADAALRLDYVLVEVNKKPHVLRDGEELALVKGDEVLVKEAGLRDKGQIIKEVNVVGFQAPKGNDDRGFAFDSAKDLKPKFSEGGKGEVYAVVAGAKGVQYGTVYLRLIEPTLRYAEISINGKPVTLRDHESLTVKGSDKVKVEKVVTNLESHDGVMFQMTEVDPAQGAYEIRFTRSGLAFATIPLRVKE